MIKKSTKLIGILIFTIIVLVTGFSMLVNTLKKDLNSLKDMTFKSIDLATIKDGKYYGEYQVEPISVKLDVIVEKGKIIRIDLIEHKNGKGKPAEAILQEITDKQDITVNTISGATYSSIIIKKAVENALTEKN